jgi:hypothetical protein
MTKQPLRITPKTILGKWSIGLIFAMPILFIIVTSFTISVFKSIPPVESILLDMAVRPALAFMMLAEW